MVEDRLGVGVVEDLYKLGVRVAVAPRSISHGVILRDRARRELGPVHGSGGSAALRSG